MLRTLGMILCCRCSVCVCRVRLCRTANELLTRPYKHTIHTFTVDRCTQGGLYVSSMMMVYAMFCARTRTHRRYHRAPPLPINLRTHTHINPHNLHTGRGSWRWCSSSGRWCFPGTTGPGAPGLMGLTGDARTRRMCARTRRDLRCTLMQCNCIVFGPRRAPARPAGLIG